ncbi:MAG TPA: hypothetical protein VIH45_03700 [Desulfuromonadaceae bacterium]
MTNLLLITDIPRLRKLFSHCLDESAFHLRIASSLEQGGEEIIADKPTMIFVQTHLSGLSADIILKHLKKQLGRKRSRFVLLSPPEQVGEEVLAQYQGHLDTSLDDHALTEAIHTTLASLVAKGKAAPPAPEAPPQPDRTEPAPETPAAEQPQPPAPQPDAPPLPALSHVPATGEPSLEEQGLTYAPRSRVSVYSEFTSSFDTAVNRMQPAEPVDEVRTSPAHEWDYGQIETVEPRAARSKRATFLLWLVPVLVVAIIVTTLQHRRQRPGTTVDVAPAKPAAAPAPAAPKPPATAAPAKPAIQQPAAGTAPQTSGQAVQPATAVNRDATPAPSAPRLTELPAFIPRTGLDKGYGAANPGWERYKGEVTEFKVFREQGAIKAIQVIDRGGKGVPESFMKTVLKQVSRNPAFVPASAEKREGYEIQRGQLADNTIKVVYYRDVQGGTIRAFVLTW